MTINTDKVEMLIEVSVIRENNLEGMSPNETESLTRHIEKSFDATMKRHGMGDYDKLDDAIGITLQSKFKNPEELNPYDERPESIYITIELPEYLPVTEALLHEVAESVIEFDDFSMDHAHWEYPKITVPEFTATHSLKETEELVNVLIENYHDVFTSKQMAMKITDDLKLSGPADLESEIDSLVFIRPRPAKAVTELVAKEMFAKLKEQPELALDSLEQAPNPAIDNYVHPAHRTFM